MLASHSNMDPSYPKAAFYHDLRVYHQVQIWLHLMNTDFECRISALGRNSFKSISLSISDSAITFAQKAPRHSLQNMEHFKPAFWNEQRLSHFPLQLHRIIFIRSGGLFISHDSIMSMNVLVSIGFVTFITFILLSKFKLSWNLYLLKIASS